jgi:hypothetical protein
MSSLCVGTLGLVGVGTAGAVEPAGATTPAHVAAHSPVGVYNTRYSDGAEGTLTVDANDTWSEVFSGSSESGYWTQLGAAIALTTNHTELSDNGCLSYGKVGASGIGTAKSPGFYNCPGGVGTWYATKGKAKLAPKSGKHGFNVSAAGTYSYNDSFNDVNEGLTLTSTSSTYEGTLAFSSTCSGEWVQQGTTVAMNINGGGCGTNSWVYVGTANPSGISSSAHKGSVTFDGTAGTWFAKRT